MAIPEEFPVILHAAGRDPWQIEFISAPDFRIGEGFIDPSDGSTRYRVVDIWHSLDKRGIFEMGKHVFLTDVSFSDDDRPANEQPSYFSDRGA